MLTDAQFAELLAGYQKWLKLAERVVHSEDTARDVVQSAFLKAWGARHRFRGESKANTWMTAIVMNEGFQTFRGFHPLSLQDLELGPGIIRELCRPDRTLEQLPAAIDVQRKLARLPRKDSRLLRDHYWWGYSETDIAERQGCSRACAKSRLLHARRHLLWITTRGRQGQRPNMYHPWKGGQRCASFDSS